VLDGLGRFCFEQIDSDAVNVQGNKAIQFAAAKLLFQIEPIAPLIGLERLVLLSGGREI